MNEKATRVLRWSAGIAGALIIVLAILAALLPLGIRFGLPYWLEQQGHEAEIRELRINWFDGILHIGGMQTRNTDGEGLTIEKGLVQFAWGPLTDKRIEIVKLELDGAALDIHQHENGKLSIAGIMMPDDPEPVSEVQTAPETPWSVDLQQIALASTQVCVQQPTLPVQHACLNVDALNWGGHLLLEQEISLLGNLGIYKLALDDIAKNESLVQVGEIHIKDFQLHENNIQSVAVRLDNGRLLQLTSAENKQSHVLQWKQLALNKLSYRVEHQLDIAEIDVLGLQATLTRNTDGAWAYQKWQVSEAEPVAETKATQETMAEQIEEPLKIKIGALKIQKDSRVRFTDHSVKPVLDLDMHSVALTVKELDSVSPKQPSPMNFRANLGKFGEIKLDGTVQPFMEKPTMHLTGSLKGIDLVPLSGLTAQYLGHQVKQGQLSADTKININSGQMDTSTDMVLSKARLQVLEGKQAEELSASVGLPLNSALNLLRDKDDSIRLTLPVTGDTASPDFDLNEVIGKVSGKAIKAAVINFYTPFGLVALVGKAFDLATALNFEPLVFKPGKATLTGKHHSGLDNLAGLLQSRPHVELVLCGHYTQSDRRELFPWNEIVKLEGNKEKYLPLTDREVSKLVKLTNQRAEAAKGYLVKNGGISAEKIILCNPELATEDKAVPEVNITI